MKKICFFNSCKVWGGGEKWHLETATALSKDSLYDIVMCVSSNSPLFEKSKNNNLKVKEFRIGNLSFLNVKLLFNLYKYFKQQKFDTIIMNLPSDLKTAGLIAKLVGIKNITYRRGSAIPIKNSLINRFLFGKILDQVIANSFYTKKTILENNRNLIQDDKIKVIYNGIDIAEYQKRKFEILYSRTSDELILGNAGRLSYQKGQKYLIDIAVELKKRGIKFKILIAGTGELEEELKSYSIEKKVDDVLVFLGFVENIKSFMMSIDIFLLTSIWEGFGYVMVEAMAAEKPVIAFDTSNNTEIVTDNETGYIVPFEDIREFCNKIEKLNKEKQLFLKMKEKTINVVIEKFTFEVFLNKVKKYL